MQSHEGLSPGAIEARRLIALAQQQYEQQQQEKQVPDMKTAITKALTNASKARLQDAVSQWDDEENSLSTKSPAPPPPPATQTSSKPLFVETTGASKATFNYVRDNPHVTTVQAVQALKAAGYNPSSTTSLLSQMVTQRLLSKDKDRKLTALCSEYRPLKNSSSKVMKVPRNVKARAKPKPTPHAAPHPKPAAAPEGLAALNVSRAQASPAQMTAKQVLETLSVKEAHALYLELKEMFGG